MGADTARALWHLARPRLLPYVLLLVLGGYGWAHWDRALTLRGGQALLGVLAAWTLLHAGTLWLNAAIDRDEGEVLMGRAVPVPDGVAAFGYAALAACVGVAFAANGVAGVAVAVCALLAVVYSHPRTAWKGHPVGGPVVNLLGYGLLTPLAGWATADVPPNPRSVAVWLLGGLGVLGCYFAAQAFQEREDAARGYRTLVVTHGPAGAVQAARLCIGLGLVGGIALGAVGWLPRVCLLLVPFWLWVDAWFRRWLREPGGGSEAWARGMAKRLLVTGLSGLAVALGAYVWQSLANEPVAGLGTVAGHPADRPLLPPGAMRAWERAQDARRAVE